MPTVQPEREQSSRIAFRQPVSGAGFVDAAWWPRTRDLERELPPLMDVLWTAGRDVNRIAFNRHSWDDAPRRMQIAGRRVQLGAFDTSDPDSVRLTDAWRRERVDIVVIAPDTDPESAQRIFDLASRTDGVQTAGQILETASADHTGQPS